MVANWKETSNFLLFRGGEVAWKKFVIEMTFLCVFDHQKSRKDVPLTAFSEAKMVWKKDCHTHSSMKIHHLFLVHGRICL